jgi:DNA-binding GntR family transcriptional regulator
MLLKPETDLAPEKRARQSITRRVESSIRHRHLSPALHAFSEEELSMGALSGAKAHIYNQLWRPIAEGRLKPGAKLLEDVIREQVEVSRPLIFSVFQQMATEGSITLPANKTPHVAKLSLQEAQDVFDAIGLVMREVITRLSAPAVTISAEQRELIEQHLDMQADANKKDAHTANLLEVEFLILLAAIHGATLLTNLVANAAVQRTMSLELYGQFPPIPWDIKAQRKLISAMLDHRGDDAVSEFATRHQALQSGLHARRHSKHSDNAALFTLEPLPKKVRG